MQTKLKNTQFVFDVISQCLLDDVIYWICDNLTPEDVFDPDTLHSWAIDNNLFDKEDEL